MDRADEGACGLSTNKQNNFPLAIGHCGQVEKNDPPLYPSSKLKMLAIIFTFWFTLEDQEGVDVIMNVGGEMFHAHDMVWLLGLMH